MSEVSTITHPRLHGGKIGGLPPIDWSRTNPAHAAQLASFRERYPLYARALDDPAAPEEDRAAMEDAWHLWVTRDARTGKGRR